MSRFAYLKSKRFWGVLVLAVSILNIGSAIAYVLSDRYIARWKDEIDPINAVVAGLAGLGLYFLCLPMVRHFFRASGNSVSPPKKDSTLHALGVFFIVLILSLPTFYLTRQFIMAPFSLAHHGYPFFLLPFLTMMLGFLLINLERDGTGA